MKGKRRHVHTALWADGPLNVSSVDFKHGAMLFPSLVTRGAEATRNLRGLFRSGEAGMFYDLTPAPDFRLHKGLQRGHWRRVYWDDAKLGKFLLSFRYCNYGFEVA